MRTPAGSPRGRPWGLSRRPDRASPFLTASVGGVARRPDWSQHTPDPRFNPYRERVGRLYRNGDEVGLLLVRVDVRATAVSGHCWWTKWSMYDSPWEWVILDGKFSDHVVGRDDAERALQDYAAGLFTTLGGTLQVEWTTLEESSRLRQEAFGVDD